MKIRYREQKDVRWGLNLMPGSNSNNNDKTNIIIVNG